MSWSYAATTMPRETPSWDAKARDDGRIAAGASRPGPDRLTESLLELSMDRRHVRPVERDVKLER